MEIKVNAVNCFQVLLWINFKMILFCFFFFVFFFFCLFVFFFFVFFFCFFFFVVVFFFKFWEIPYRQNYGISYQNAT